MTGRSSLAWRHAVMAFGCAVMLASAGGALAQETAEQKGGGQASPAGEQMIPASRIPFFADWAKSPHARADAEAFNHWNKDGKIPVQCAGCHSTPGFLDFVGADGSAPGKVDKEAATGTLIYCSACHNEMTRELTAVTFPSGLRVEDLGANARCMTCHQGRAAGSDVDKAVAGMDRDKVSPKLEFINVHYRAAGATLMGSLARGAYEYDGKSYASRRRHPEPFNQCTGCHELHTVAPKVGECAACHKQVTDADSLRAIRESKIDHDGDGDVGEGIAREVDQLNARLLVGIKAYARTVAGKAIAYDAKAFPYFFNDANGNGVADADEAKVPNKYNAWTPRLLKAAYNYQFVAKDPGAYAHNPAYVLQILHDSLEDIGAGNGLGPVTRP